MRAGVGPRAAGRSASRAACRDGAVRMNPVPMFPVGFQHPLRVVPLPLFLVAPPCMALAPFVFRGLAARPRDRVEIAAVHPRVRSDGIGAVEALLFRLA